MQAMSGADLTFADRSSAEAEAIARQRVLCARSVISFAENVPQRDYLPVLLLTLSSPLEALRHVAAASLHALSTSHVGAPCYACRSARGCADVLHALSTSHVGAPRPCCC